jgi:hypothetical protein
MIDNVEVSGASSELGETFLSSISYQFSIVVGSCKKKNKFVCHNS